MLKGKLILILSLLLGEGCIAEPKGVDLVTVLPDMSTGRPVVSVTMSNAETPLSLYLDTGSDVTILFDSALEKLGLDVPEVSDDPVRAGMFSGTLEGETLPKVTVSLGDSDQATTEISPHYFFDVTSSPELSAAARRADGILGHDALGAFNMRVTVDGLPKFELSHPAQAVDGSSPDRPHMTLQIEGKPVACALDTGYAANPAIMIRAFADPAEDLRSQAGQYLVRTSTLNRSHRMQQQISSIGLPDDETVFRAIIGVELPKEGPAPGAHGMDGCIIGLNALKFADFTYDAGVGSLAMHIRQAPDLTHNRSGIASLRPARPGGGPVIGALDPSSPADLAGLAPGDEITAIDDVPIQTLGRQGYVARMGQKAGTSVDVTIRRGTEQRTVELVLQDMM